MNNDTNYVALKESDNLIINFLKNGFEIKNKGFIPYQSITLIDEIKFDTGNYDHNFQHYGKYIYKFVSFKIFTKNRILKIYLEDDIKKHLRLPEKGHFLLKFFDKFNMTIHSMSNEAFDWLYDPDDNFKEETERLEKIRNKFIKKFNEWKNTNKCQD